MAIPLLLRYRISSSEKITLTILVILCVLFCVFLIFYFFQTEHSLIVATKSGKLSGKVFTTIGGRQVFAFLGVPFAEPPVGEFRFQEAQPVSNWSGIKTAYVFGPKCIQFTYYNMRPDPVIGEEDCLYLNIFTPVISNSSKLDVIFYIHGGGFMYGSGDMVTPDHILDRADVVFVSVNYRLGPFGFMTTEDGVIPGNLGLKDQILALKWVRENIEEFGGDGSKITLAGLSAGGASVHLHMLSPLSKNLFHRAISMSGTAFCPWVFAEKSAGKTKTLASSVQCPTENSKLLLECLQTKPAKDVLLQLDKLFMPWFYNPFSPFGVVIEGNSSTAFLPAHPVDILKSNQSTDVPWLTSATTEEGLYPGASFVNNETLLRDLDKNWNKIAPYLLDFKHTIPPCHLNIVSQQIRNFYLNNTAISSANKRTLIKMLTDRLFVSDIEQSVKFQTSVTNSSVYFYLFGYRGVNSLSEGIFNLKEDLGVSHGDDMMYLLKSVFKTSATNIKEDEEMIDKMVNIWMSFVKTGIPSAGNTTEWSPVSKSVDKDRNIDYLMINSSTNITQLSSEDLGNYKFWNSLHFDELIKKY